jgi:regulator of protease activity HflC (stomatin/prohibitin superfamily)
MDKDAEQVLAKVVGRWKVVGSVLAAGLVFFMSYFTVEQYERGVVKTWGKISYVADPGLSFKVPFVQSVSYQRTDVLSLQPDKKVAYENAQDYRERLFNLANDRLKAEMGKVKLEHFAEHRGQVRDGVLHRRAECLGVVHVGQLEVRHVDAQRERRLPHYLLHASTRCGWRSTTRTGSRSRSSAPCGC